MESKITGFKFLSAKQNESVMVEDIRKSVVAGSWYPDNPRTLREDIETYFNRVTEDPVQGKIIGLVAPHAGYIYSGQVAAHAYKQIMNKYYDVVIVVGPSHRLLFNGVSVLNKGGYETPLGIVRVHEDIANKIMKRNENISDIKAAHVQEHAIEIQLPFLQVALGDFDFVPIVMGNQDYQMCKELAETIIRAVENKNALVVGSSDLSHFYPYTRAMEMDQLVLKHIKKMDAVGLARDMEENLCEACGGGPIVATTMVAKRLGADKARLLKYANSGDVTGDKHSVVGYASAIFFDSHPV
jgi:AmmeMemoRadiSam system protein B